MKGQVLVPSAWDAVLSPMMETRHLEMIAYQLAIRIMHSV